MKNPDSPPGRAWFVYRRMPGRFVARPVTAMGWIAFGASIAATVVLASVTARAIGPNRPIAEVIALLAVLALGLGWTFAMVKAKGRPG